MNTCARVCLFLVLVSCSGGGPSGGRTADVSKSTVEVKKTTATADENDGIEVTVTAKDASSAPVPGVLVVVSSSGAADSGGTTSTTDASGQVTTTVRSKVAGPRTITATITTAAGPALLETKPVVTFVAGPLAGLRFAVQPTQARVGQPLRPAVTLAAEDANGNPVQSSPVTVGLRLVRTGGGVLTGGAAKAISDGGIVFDALTIDRPQTGVALRAEASNGNATESSLFDVVP
jgi:hypothetical protein